MRSRRRGSRLWLWLLLGALYAVAAWIGGLVALAALLVASLLYLMRLRRALAPTLRCPDGHAVPTYGRFACGACGAETMGSAWQCPWCGTRFGHLSCPVCGLSVGNPLHRS